jgi:IS605 OrfB family transposase
LRLKLASQDQWDEWRPLFESKKGKEENDRRQNLEAVALKYAPTKWLELAEAVKEQITDYCEDADSLDKLLVAVIEFCLPLRGRHWSWSYTENKARLSWGKDDEDPAWNPNIQGMRGLSMRRLDQILNLRQRCQSFAKLEDRYHRQFLKNDFNPPDSVPREEIDDVCPLLLERSNRIREQRVNQAAHLILAEALGMELKNPAEVENKNGRKNEVDLHGEYQRRKDKNGKPYPRCSVIVLENLERYRTSQERTRSENSRLMQWAHRAIIEKLEDMCRPFGITLMLVDPAFTSHFDSRNGLPGVRVNQVSRGFHVQYPYAKWINDKTKKGDKTSLALEIEKLIADFDAHPNYGGTLVLAVEGGKEFVPVMSPEGGESVVNADITAAANIGLRGVADPQRWDIFPRLRTKQVSDTQVRVTSWRGWFGKLMPEQRMMGKAVAGGVSELPAPAAKTKRKKADSEGAETGDKADSQSGQSSEYPPFFVEHPQHDWLPANDWLKKLALEFVQDGKKLRAYPQGAYLKRVELECTTRIEAINRARIQKWERGNDDVPM